MDVSVNENNEIEKNEDFWDFVFEFRNVVDDENIKLLDNYVAVEKEKVLAKKHIDEAVPI